MADNVPITAGTGTSIATDDVGGVQFQRVKPAVGADGSATDVSAAAPMPSNVTDGTNIASVFPATFLRMTDEPHQMFYDPFDTALETTNYWTAPTTGNSAVAATVTSGVMSMGTGTTASGWSKLFSQASFRLPIPGWLGFSFAITIPDLAAPTANSYRFWGSGTPATTPTTTAPMTDAVGFEIRTDGKMYAVIYAGGSRTVIQDLSAATGNSTQPTNASAHRYIVYVRTDRAYWYIDGLASANLVATSSFQSPTIQTLPISFVAAGGATPPVSNSQIQCTGAVVWDTSKLGTTLQDGTYGWRTASVDASGRLAVNNALVNGIAVQTGTGTAGTGTQRVAVASDSSIVLAAGSADVGNIINRRDLLRIAVTSGSLTTTSPTYTAGDQAGSQFTFANAARSSGGSGLIVGCELITASDVTGAFDLLVTDSTITLAGDNSPFAISDADALKIVGLLQMATNFDIGNNRIAQIFNISIPYTCSGGTSLFGGLITRSANTVYGAATDIQLNLYVERA